MTITLYLVDKWTHLYYLCLSVYKKKPLIFVYKYQIEWFAICVKVFAIIHISFVKVKPCMKSSNTKIFRLKFYKFSISFYK